MIKLTSAVWGGCAAFVIAASAGGSAQAVSKETIIHNFANATGKSPITGPVVDASTGVFYGVTWQGGTKGDGVIYQVLPPTPPATKWTYSVIYNSTFAHSFLAAADGVVYVSTDGIAVNAGGGGSSNCGVIASLTPPVSGTGEWAETNLYSFKCGADGAFPKGPLSIDSQGALYGTAYTGGTGCAEVGGCGSVFKLAPPSTPGQPWIFSVIYHFAGGQSGQAPNGGVIFDNSGNLYGSASLDPSPRSLVFKLTPPSGSGEWTESVLSKFYPSSDCYSSGPVSIDANGALYGTFSAYASPAFSSCTDTSTEYVFQLKPSASNPNVWTKTEMRSFPYTGSAAAYKLTAPVTVDSSGNVYGATLAGGTSGEGTVFVLQPSAGVPGKWTYKTLFDFAAEGSNSPNANTTGAAPNGGLVFDSGYLYGTTQAGGSGGRGVFYRLTP